jgi:hypothetical protein
VHGELLVAEVGVEDGLGLEGAGAALGGGVGEGGLETAGIDGVDGDVGGAEEGGGLLELFGLVEGILAGAEFGVDVVWVGEDDGGEGTGEPEEVFAAGDGDEVAGEVVEGGEGVGLPDLLYQLLLV